MWASRNSLVALRNHVKVSQEDGLETLKPAVELEKILHLFWQIVHSHYLQGKNYMRGGAGVLPSTVFRSFVENNAEEKSSG